jgi:D-proline reductase (dithiol) PrdB
VASVAELPLRYRLLLRVYRWRRIDPVPCAQLVRPLTSCRVALVGTAGLVPPGAPPFDASIKGGDVSYRVVAGDADAAALGDWHRSDAFDHAGLARDRNLAFPLDRLRELAADGIIGRVAPRHLSFMGSITAPGRLARFTAPEAAALLVADRVDLALLVPV